MDSDENEQGLPPVPKKLHAKNRIKLVQRLKEVAPNSVVLFQGGHLINHYNTDTVYQFRQVRMTFLCKDVYETNVFLIIIRL